MGVWRHVLVGHRNRCRFSCCVGRVQ